MEFPFRLPSLVGAPSGHSGPYVGCLDDKLLRNMSGNLTNVLDTIGKKSAIAQGLKKPVTYGSACSLLGQRVYIMVDDRCALGFIKVGTKRLFVAPPALHVTRTNHTCVQDALKEISPVCVLDFYVHESCQRSGMGRRLFDEMLRQEGLSAAQLAYDRPSAKFLPFLRKHFGLSKYQPQNNNFVIFDEYFAHGSVGGRTSRSSSVRKARSSDVTDNGYGASSGRGAKGQGVLPLGFSVGPSAEPPQPIPTGRSSSCTQRPPLPPTFTSPPSSAVSAVPFPGRSIDAEGDIAIGASSSMSRPPSLGSNSRLPLGAAPFKQCTVPSTSSLQTPWGTAADLPTAASRHARGAASSGTFFGMESSMAAGMPSAGQGRSASVPCGGHARNRNENPLTGFASEAPLGSSSGNGSRRYASPLSHAGQRMLAL